MAHKCFISFKTEDMDYKKKIQEDMDIDMIDKSLDEPINSDDEDYIMRKIREDYLADSTVTIYLIGEYSAENSFLQDQTYIKRELQASLYNGENNTKNGILGIVLPSMYDKVYKGKVFIDTLILPPCLVPSYRHRPMMNRHRTFFIYRRILNEQYRNQHRHLPDCQKADRQDHLYRPCPFQRDRKRDNGGQNQAYAP